MSRNFPPEWYAHQAARRRNGNRMSGGVFPYGNKGMPTLAMRVASSIQKGRLENATSRIPVKEVGKYQPAVKGAKTPKQSALFRRLGIAKREIGVQDAHLRAIMRES